MKFVSVIAAAMVLTGSANAQTLAAGNPQKRPVAHFATLPFMSGPRLSPDGRQVAAKLAVNGKQVLAIISLFEPDKKPFVVGLGDNELNSWTWVNNGWLAISIGALSQVEGDPIYVSRIAGVSADAKSIKPIAFKDGGQSARILWAARDGSPRILMSMQKSIYVGEDFWPEVSEVDVSSGRAKRVVGGQPGVMTWIADPAGNVRMGVGSGDDGRSSRLLYRDNAKSSFRVVDRARSAERSLVFPVLLTGPQTRAVTLSSDSGQVALHDLDLSSLVIGKKIFGVDGYDIDDVMLTESGDGVAGVAYTSDRARTHWMTPALAEAQALLDKAVGDRTADIVSLTPDQQTMLVLVGGGDQPGSYYYFNTGSNVMKRFAYVNLLVKNDRLGPVSTYRYKARDGISIESVLTLPKGADPKKLPLILLPHGGPEARDSIGYDWWAQFLADRGYAVLQPNYRGSTGYGRAFQDAGDGQWGLKMQDDLNDAVDDLAAKGVIDPGRVCIAGASYGGYAAMRAAQRDGKRFRCAISYAGVADLNGMIRYDSNFLNGGAMRDSWRKSAPDLKAVSPIEHAADFGTPILIMHGKKDLRVPVGQSRKMADRLKAAGKTVEYVEQPEGDHHFSREADRLQFLETMEKFLIRYNPAS